MPDPRRLTTLAIMLLIAALAGCQPQAGDAHDPDTPRPQPSPAAAADTVEDAMQHLAPSTLLIHPIGPAAYTAQMGSCLLRQGIPVTTADDALSFEDVPADRQADVLPATARCRLRFPVDGDDQDGPAGVRLERTDIERLHAYLTEQVIPCLQRHGLDGFAPPSRDAFTQTWNSTYAYLPTRDPAVPQLQQLTAQQWQEIRADCEPIPEPAALQP